MPLTSPRHSVHPLNGQLQAERDRLEKTWRPRIERAYADVLKQLGDEAALRYRRAVSGRPILGASDWQPPHPDEIYPDDANDRIHNATDQLRNEMFAATVGGVSGKVGVSLDLSNPLLAGVLQGMGQHITAVAESQRAAIMGVVQGAYDSGLSIANTAAAIRSETAISSVVRATAIARTELTGATNAASVAAASEVNAASGGGVMKAWTSAEDDFVRPAHEDADAEYGADPIPVDQPFVVDGEEMMHPGDPNGSPGNVINCRCTTTYVQPDETAAPAGLSSGPGYSPPSPQEDVAPPLEAGEAQAYGLVPFSETGAEIRDFAEVRPGAARYSNQKLGLPESYTHSGGHYGMIRLKSGYSVRGFVERDPNGAMAIQARQMGLTDAELGERRLRALAVQLDALPANMQRRFKAVALAAGRNPGDEYWSRMYGRDVTAAATARSSEGTITAWGGYGIAQRTLLHEGGHILGGDGGIARDISEAELQELAAEMGDMNSNRGQMWWSWSSGGPRGATGGAQWVSAALKDRAATNAWAARDIDGAIGSRAGGHPITWNELGVTTYGREAAFEDWAESIRLYLYDQRVGPIASIVERDPKTGFVHPVDVRFADLFPNRARLLRKLFPPGRQGSAVVEGAGDLLIRRVVLNDLDDVAGAVGDGDAVGAAVRRRAVYTLRGHRSDTVPEPPERGK